MLLNLAVNYKDLKGPSVCCGYSKRTQSALLAAIQITLIVCAILALARVGSFEHIGNLRVVYITCGSFVLITDIVLTAINRTSFHKIAKARAEMEKLLPIGQSLDGAYSIDLTKKVRNSQKNYAYPVFKAEELQAQYDRLAKQETGFFFYFARQGVHTLLETDSSEYNVRLCVKQDAFGPQEAPTWYKDDDVMPKIINGQLQSLQREGAPPPEA